MALLRLGTGEQCGTQLDRGGPCVPGVDVRRSGIGGAAGVGECEGGREGVGQSCRVLAEASHRLGCGAGEFDRVGSLGRGTRGQPAGAVEADQALHQAQQLRGRLQGEGEGVAVDDRERGQAAAVPPVHPR